MLESFVTKERDKAAALKFMRKALNLHNHFNSQRHLVDRTTFKQRRSAALAEWQSLFS